MTIVLVAITTEEGREIGLRLDVAVQTGIGDAIHGANSIPTYREVAVVVVQDHTRAHQLAHHLFPDHHQGVTATRSAGTGDGADPLAEPRRQMKEVTGGAGDAVHLTVMIEIDPLPAIIRHAHLVPEDVDDTLPRAAPRAPQPPDHIEEAVSHPDLFRDLVPFLAPDLGLGIVGTEPVGGDRILETPEPSAEIHGLMF